MSVVVKVLCPQHPPLGSDRESSQSRDYHSGMKVHTALGPGLLESTYLACLQYELEKAGLECLCQVALPAAYDGVKLEGG